MSRSCYYTVYTAPYHDTSFVLSQFHFMTSPRPFPPFFPLSTCSSPFSSPFLLSICNKFLRHKKICFIFLYFFLSLFFSISLSGFSLRARKKKKKKKKKKKERRLLRLRCIDTYNVPPSSGAVLLAQLSSAQLSSTEFDSWGREGRARQGRAGLLRASGHIFFSTNSWSILFSFFYRFS